ncbi:hypothetical protein PPC_3793 [Pseudomonas protegens Cab57]|nr:hypothetical protein PPC_3793 [Pseudomonas protegens Cab57]
MGRAAAQAKQQVLAQARPAFKQGAGPVDGTGAGLAAFALPALIQVPRPGLGIRPPVSAGADA